jgi:hypothetical protein
MGLPAMLRTAERALSTRRFEATTRITHHAGRLDISQVGYFTGWIFHLVTDSPECARTTNRAAGQNTIQNQIAFIFIRV